MDRKTDCDIAVIGGGVAGMTAGIYGALAGLRTLVFEKETVGGQIALASLVENYPGVTEPVDGPTLSQRMREQVEKFGGEIRSAAVTRLEAPADSPVRTLHTSSGPVTALAAIIASGAHHRELGIPGEREFVGKGVSRCAYCDAFFFKGRDIVVVGGGNSAVQESIHLAKICGRIRLVHRRDRLRADDYLQQQLREFDHKVTYFWDTVCTAIHGDEAVASVTLKNLKTGEEQEIPTAAVFIFIGFDPSTAFLRGVVELDEEGYVVTDRMMRTSVPGVFACGDVRNKVLRQMVVACGEGAMAAVAAQDHVQRLRGGGYEPAVSKRPES